MNYFFKLLLWRFSNVKESIWKCVSSCSAMISFKWHLWTAMTYADSQYYLNVYRGMLKNWSFYCILKGGDWIVILAFCAYSNSISRYIRSVFGIICTIFIEPQCTKKLLGKDSQTCSRWDTIRFKEKYQLDINFLWKFDRNTKAQSKAASSFLVLNITSSKNFLLTSYQCLWMMT